MRIDLRARQGRFCGLEQLELRQLLSAAPTLIDDIYPGTTGSVPTLLTAAGSKLFFVANDSVHGNELWSSTGTTAGTSLVSDIYAGSSDSSINDPVNNNGTLYFNAYNATGRGLFKSDGTSAGTVRLSTSITSGPNSITAYNGAIYYIDFANAGSFQLFRSDGTPGGTGLFKSFNGISYPQTMAVANGSLYFVAADSTHSSELWKTDGTVAGTVMVDDIAPGNASSTISYLTALGNEVYFRANDGTHGAELWKSDGSAAGTTMVADLTPGSSGTDLYDLTPVGNRLLFNNDGQLWATDGTTSGTVELLNEYPENMTNVNGELFFTTDLQLWKSDGTVGGTSEVRDIWTAAQSDASTLTAVNNTLYFVAANEIWKSDGTSAGTVAVSSAFSAAPTLLTAAGGNLFFVANDGTHGNELWGIISTTTPTWLSPGSGAAYTFDGTTLNVTAGSVTFTGDAGAGVSVVASGSANLAFNASQHLSKLELDGTSTAQLAAGGSNVLVVGNLTMANTAKLDLTNNSMIIDYATGATSPLSTAAGYIKTGYNGGKFNASVGLTSSSVNTTRPNTALGAIDNSQLSPRYTMFAGQSVDATAVLIKYTFNGDSDLNGKVDANDYSRIDAGYQNQHNAGFADDWFNGDFNYDGKIDANDYALIDGAYQTQGSTPLLGPSRVLNSGAILRSI